MKVIHLSSAGLSANETKIFSVALQVKLSTKSFGRDAAEVAAEAMTNVAGSLVDADMSDIIAGRPEAEALEALRIVSAALSRLQLRCGALGDLGTTGDMRTA